ncbi:hypothetical protein ACH41E_17495 [Streptomyces sp. NPDC020412]|uniref:hypothetical protein n=1 Tax=Streptomyces sp. NPDC020412 TaxID=3365073 RepID=UPI0037A21B74
MDAGLRLNALLAERADEVTLMADLLTVEDARRTAAALPGAEFNHGTPRVDPVTREHLDFGLDIATADGSLLKQELPLSVLHYVAPGAVEDRIVRAVGQGIASIGSSGRWPDDPNAVRAGTAPGRCTRTCWGS